MLRASFQVNVEVALLSKVTELAAGARAAEIVLLGVFAAVLLTEATTVAEQR